MFGGIGDVSSLVSSLAPRALTSLTADPSLDRYLAILNSGRVLGAVIRKFDLVNVYGITDYPQEETTLELLDNIDISAEPEGHLTITVYDEDPQRAADMANFFVEQLNQTNREIRGQNARANREYVETRYNENISALAIAEDSLREFQSRYGVIAMPEQTEASIRAGAELTAQLAMKEVQLRVLKTNQSADSPLVISAQTEVTELRRMIAEMSSGEGASKKDVNVFVPFREIPHLGTEYIRRFRDVEIQNEILKFLTPLYEQAKVEERRQTPSVLILDKAYPAERKARPKRIIIVLVGTFLGLIGSIGYISVWSWWREQERDKTEIFSTITKIVVSVSQDLKGFTARFRRNRT